MRARGALLWPQRQSMTMWTLAFWVTTTSGTGPPLRLLWKMWTRRLSSSPPSTSGKFQRTRWWELWLARLVPETLTQSTIPSGNVTPLHILTQMDVICLTPASVIVTRCIFRLGESRVGGGTSLDSPPQTAPSTGWKIIPFQIVLLARCIHSYPWSLWIPRTWPYLSHITLVGNEPCWINHGHFLYLTGFSIYCCGIITKRRGQDVGM